MVDQEQINRWLADGTITQEQANKMLADSVEYRKEKSSGNIVVAASTIGSVLLGLGAILFIASNWAGIPDFMKVMIMLIATFSTLYIGYIFRYQKKNLPKVGTSLIFLGALLFGASIFLIAQIYNINANSHVLMIIWILGILPLVYAFESKPIAVLSSILFFVWMSLFVFRGMDFWDVLDTLIKLPALYLVSGILFFGLGALHYLKESLTCIGRLYRIIGLKVAMGSLFFLTFSVFSKTYSYSSDQFFSEQFSLWFTIFAILSIVVSFANLFFNPSKSETSAIENGVSLGLALFVWIFFFFPSSTSIYTLLFNLIMAGLILTLIYIGYSKSDMALVNIGFFWMAIFIFVKYFDFFWNLMDRSLLFMVGGLILVLGGISLEKKRRQLKTQFIKPKIEFNN